MGAGSRGEGGGEWAGGGLWAAAPFIAAAGREGVPCFWGHGGANSCYQQAPGRLQHGGRRHHPAASDCRRGNAGETRATSAQARARGAGLVGAAAAQAPGPALRPMGGGRCLGPRGYPGSAVPDRPGLSCTGAGNPGLAGRRGAEPARRA